MRKRRSEVAVVDLEGPRGVVAVPIDGARALVMLGPHHWVWDANDCGARDFARTLAAEGSLVWVDPPAGKDGQALVQLLRSAGVVARTVPGSAVPAAVPEQEAAAPAPARAELRIVVMELARAAEADYPGVVDLCEQTLAEGGL